MTSPRMTCLVIVTLLSLPLAARAQQRAAIQGIVAESNRGRPLADVAVSLEANGKIVYGTHTNQNGVYRIDDIRAGAYTLRARLLGYREHVQAVTLVADKRLTVSFRVDRVAAVLNGIVVNPEQSAAVTELGRQVVTPQQIRAVPVPGGTGDLVSYLQTLPGVTTAGDRGGQVFVRGGLPAENDVLVDGIPIYQPFHILGFYSVFPEDLVSSADFYAGGFGARYHGRTSSVLDVHLRDGDSQKFRASGSLSPFVADAVVGGPIREGASWLASVRHSLIQQTGEALLGTPEPISFESELLKISSGRNDGCSVLAMRTADRGQIDPRVKGSHISWDNKLLGLKCLTLRENGRRIEVNWSYSGSSSAALTYGASNLHSSIWRMQHDLHVNDLLGSVPVEAGYELYDETMNYDLSELFADQADGSFATILGVSAYGEAELSAGRNLHVKPGVVLVVSPTLGVEPRLRASWTPFGPSGGTLQGAFGVYRQSVTGISDMRDVGSVFTAWMKPDGGPLQATHEMLGWQQPLGNGFRWSLEGYAKQLKNIPVAVWQAAAQFTTTLGRANGTVKGADARVELSRSHFYGFVGYGYNWTLYRSAQAGFADWFGQPVQSYHPAQDRRNQVNALATVDAGAFRLSARWQFGSGLPFTQPLGFDESFGLSNHLYDVHTSLGTTRLVLDKPFTGRLPAVHRLDVSVERGFDLPVGRLTVQAGAINAYDQRNMFYYDLYTGHRLDQLPLAPYVSLTLGTR